MRDRMAQILVLVIEEILDDPHTLGDLEELAEALVARGVDAAEAQEVIGWLLAALGEGRETEEPRAGEGRPLGVHVFDRNDRGVLSLEAQGLLIELRELGLLDDIQVEEVVERATLRAAIPLGRDEVREIVAEILLDAAAGRRGPLPYWHLSGGDEGAIH